MLRALLLTAAFASFVSATGSKPKVEAAEVVSGEHSGSLEVAAAIPVIPVDEPIALSSEEDSKKVKEEKHAKKGHGKKGHGKKVAKKTKHQVRSLRKKHKHHGMRHTCGDRISDELNKSVAEHTQPHVINCETGKHPVKHVENHAAVAMPKSAEEQAVKDTEQNISNAKKEVQAIKDLPKIGE